ncbi:MAG: OmpH family outer membrane protein [bacterium]
MKRYIAGLVLWGAVVILLGPGPAYSASMRIAVVDIQRAVAESKAGKKARTTLEREKKRLEIKLIAKRGGLENMVKQIRDLQLEIQQKGPIWRPEERDRKTQELRRRRRAFSRREDELKRLVQESRRDLGARQQKLMKSLIKQTREVVQEIAREGKYELIIDKNIGGVLFVTKSVDITDSVIQLYDKKKK